MNHHQAMTGFAHFAIIILAAAAGVRSSHVRAAETVPLDRSQLIQALVERNRDIRQAQVAEQVGKWRLKAEEGIFEPVFSLGSTYSTSERENTAVQQAEQSINPILGQPQTIEVYENRELSGEAAIDTLLPAGTQVHVGYSYANFENTVNDFDREYADFVGVEITQPLLRGFGEAVNKADIRLAEQDLKVRRQELRKRLSLTLAQAERAYWQFCRLYELLQMRNESEERAQTLLEDARQRLDAGKLSQLDVYQAETGVAQRQAETEEAAQQLAEIRNQLKTLLEEEVTDNEGPLVPTDELRVKPRDFDLARSLVRAFANQPDYRIETIRLKQTQTRVDKAQNRTKPKLDLTASYGLNAYSNSSRGDAFDDFGDARYERASIGFRFETGLFGNNQYNAELEAALLEKQQAEIRRGQLKTQLTNELDTRIKHLESLARRIDKLASSVEFNQQLLDVTIDRMKQGKEDMRKVLKVEEDLVNAQEKKLRAVATYRQVYLQYELLQGSVLESRDIDIDAVSALEDRL